jgi:hypothetical protein
MDGRKGLAGELNTIEQLLKELHITYEQYFAGVEKREPMKVREDLAARLRRFANRRITQTDLRFRYQGLAARYHSYSAHWDRILRLIDEGRYVRQVRKASAPAPAPAAATTGSPPPATEGRQDDIYRELMAARSACHIGGKAPDRAQIAAFLDTQREKIRERFGDREVEFTVVCEDGKPKIKVRPKP